MTENVPSTKITKDDLAEQANLPDVDQITSDPDKIETLLEEILKETKQKRYKSDFFINIVASVVFSILTLLVSLCWDKISAKTEDIWNRNSATTKSGPP